MVIAVCVLIILASVTQSATTKLFNQKKGIKGKNICKLFMSKTRIVEINSAVLFFIFKRGDQK